MGRWSQRALRGGGGTAPSAIAPPADSDWTFAEPTPPGGDVELDVINAGPGTTPGAQYRFRIDGGAWNENAAFDVPALANLGPFTVGQFIEAELRWCDMPSETPISDYGSTKSLTYV